MNDAHCTKHSECFVQCFIRFIRSRRNKHPEVEKILTDSKIHVLALMETHLDNSVKNSELHIENCRFYQKDRNSNGGGVCFYIHSHMTVNIDYFILFY